MDSSRPSGGTPPPPVRTFRIPEHELLKRLRDMAAIRGDGGTPEASARLAIYRATAEVLRLLLELKRRIERGERCRVVEVEQTSELGELSLKFKIETQRGP
jgi:hypothetical protein